MPSPIQLLDDPLIESVIARAKSHPRLRMNHNFHAAADDNPHRFLNVLVQGTYCPPHRHKTPPKSEAFVILRGQVGLLIFSEAGEVSEVHRLGENGVWGIDLEPGIWHTIVALSPVAVCYEVKPGPWDPSTDKEFAPWAPLEGASEASAYLAWLNECVRDA